MLIYTYQKSKKEKKTKQEAAEYQQWLDSMKAQTTNFSGKYKVKSIQVSKKPVEQYHRETPHYPSRNTGIGNATKPIYGKQYTGDKILGIGTLHKSNAVPIFSKEEAVDQANMRR
jgi:hypothetical protein